MAFSLSSDSLNQFINLVKLLVSLLPVLITAVKEVEAIFPEKGQGQVKLEMVRGLLQAAYSHVTSSLAGFDDLWPSLQKLIGQAVSIFNSVGVFSSTKQ
jgi:hypothetical protein